MPAKLRVLVLAIVLAGTSLAACSNSGGDTRTIEVDHGHDEFAGTFRGFFPHDVTVKPGMTLKFHQTWTGEEHTVTMGTGVQELVEPVMLPVIRAARPFDVDDRTLSPELNEAAGPFFEKLPFFFGQNGPDPAAAQPCFLDTGLPTSGKACPQKAQPAFTGKQSYYSSGFIPYQGSRGNEFTMKIAEDAKPGKYFYYCNLHGPGMSGEITVTKSGTVPSQGALNKEASKELAQIATPLVKQLNKERAGKGGYKGNLVGSGSDALYTVLGQVNEFTPRTVKAAVGKPVTWTFIGEHSISFNVPPYVPLIDFNKKGKVVENESVFGPSGGWPSRNPPVEDHSGGGPPQPSVQVDAGKFDGSGGLKSSGTDWQTGDTYSVTFTKAGTYPMACLIHPGMIGKVVVS